jgi:Fur family transcriptional regulator, stress-responsive regulator
LPRFADMRSPTELASAFRAAGLKVTPQRQLLFRLLHENQTHPTAEGLYALASSEMPGISLRTVYQTLNDLCEMGELHLIEFGAGSSRFDPNVADHHHVICNSCGDIRDVHVAGVERLAPGEPAGFATLTTEIVFRGLCATCAGAADQVPTR